MSWSINWRLLSRRALLCSLTMLLCIGGAARDVRSEPTVAGPTVAEPTVVEVLGQIEGIEIQPEEGSLRNLDFVVSVILIPHVDLKDHFPDRQLRFRVHSPTRSGLGTDPLEVGKFYLFKLEESEKSPRVISYSFDKNWSATDRARFSLGKEKVLITLEDLIKIRNAFCTYLQTWDGAVADREWLLTSLKHTSVSFFNGGSARIGSFILTTDGKTLVLEDIPRPSGPEARDTFGFRAEVHRAKGLWVVDKLAHIHTRWLKQE